MRQRRVRRICCQRSFRVHTFSFPDCFSNPRLTGRRNPIEGEKIGNCLESHRTEGRFDIAILRCRYRTGGRGDFDLVLMRYRGGPLLLRCAAPPEKSRIGDIMSEPLQWLMSPKGHCQGSTSSDTNGCFGVHTLRLSGSGFRPHDYLPLRPKTLLI